MPESGEICRSTPEETYPTVFCVGERLKFGGPELLPAEVPYDFNGIRGRLSTLTKEKRDSIFWVMGAVLGWDEQSIPPIPLGVEIGRESESAYFGTDNSSVLELDELRPRINHRVDVGLTPPVMAGFSGSGYVQARIEELAQVLSKGRRANFAYLSNVLTDDIAGADISDSKKLIHILRELYESLMPRGVLSMSNIRNITQAKQLKRVGFDVLFDGRLKYTDSTIFVAQKR